MGDGWCDEKENIEECAFDGGDCCGDQVLQGIGRVFECLAPESGCQMYSDSLVKETLARKRLPSNCLFQWRYQSSGK